MLYSLLNRLLHPGMTEGSSQGDIGSRRIQCLGNTMRPGKTRLGELVRIETYNMNSPASRQDVDPGTGLSNCPVVLSVCFHFIHQET